MRFFSGILFRGWRTHEHAIFQGLEDVVAQPSNHWKEALHHLECCFHGASMTASAGSLNHNEPVLRPRALSSTWN